MTEKLNFSWIIENKLGASAVPRNKSDLKWLISKKGVKTVITLTENSLSYYIKYFSSVKKELGFKNVNLPTDDGDGFFIHQYEKITKIYKDEIKYPRPLLVHCEGGFGRTSTILIALFMYEDKQTFEVTFTKLQKLRPQLIVTSLQEQSLKEWFKKFSNY